MATPPSKPNPLHGKPAPAIPPEPTEATQLKLNIHGQPPTPNMAPPPEPDRQYGSVVDAELEAGRRALTDNKARTNAEHEAGRRNAAYHSRSKKED